MDKIDRLGWAAGIAFRIHGLTLGIRVNDASLVERVATTLPPHATRHDGGTVEIEVLVDGGRRGIGLTFRDHGPGIPDVAAALRDGFTTGGGLGLGLGGARRLCNDFDLQSTPGDGTVVRIVRWR